MPAIRLLYRGAIYRKADALNPELLYGAWSALKPVAEEARQQVEQSAAALPAAVAKANKLMKEFMVGFNSALASRLYTTLVKALLVGTGATDKMQKQALKRLGQQLISAVKSGQLKKADLLELFSWKAPELPQQHYVDMSVYFDPTKRAGLAYLKEFIALVSKLQADQVGSPPAPTQGGGQATVSPGVQPAQPQPQQTPAKQNP